MRKRINSVTKLLLFAMIVLMGLGAFLGWYQYESIVQFNSDSHQIHRMVVENVIRTASSVIWDAAFVGGLAALVEIADKIRWHLKNSG
jgi:hypothetical protein